jgi:hypothetical protein
VRISVVGAVFVLALAVCFELAWPPFFEFPPEREFRGERWYQPYAGYRGGGLLGNFHAHADAWGGLTFGELSRAELYALYKARGYDVIGISDYMSIAPAQPGDPLHLSAYEHGYTIGRRHQTVIGADHVDWFDYPLGGSVRSKQDVIDELRPAATLLVLNHPTKADSYDIEDFAQLTGYDALEVATKYGVWDDFWDAALSAGRPVWGMAADDGHAQTSGDSHVGIGSVVIHTKERTPEAILRALREGRFHSNATRQNETPLPLLRCEIEDGELVVRVGRRADVIRFFSAHGIMRREEWGREEARYRLAPDDPYVRVEVVAQGAVLYLNPVIRWDGVALPRPQARMLPVPTWTARGVAVLALLVLARFSAKWVRAGRERARSRGRVPASPGGPSRGSD